MSKVISLREIIAALEAASDDCTSYLDPETGEIVVVTEEERALAEDPCWEEAPAWQREMMPKIRAALESDRFLELPDRFDIHEWSIMERFARAQKHRANPGRAVECYSRSGSLSCIPECHPTTRLGTKLVPVSGRSSGGDRT